MLVQRKGGKLSRAVIYNAQKANKKERYRQRREAGECVDCGAHGQLTARCDKCAGRTSRQPHDAQQVTV